ncbi:MAG: YybH family protein [Nitrospinota bacterium]
MSTEAEVRNASEQFYAALNSLLNGDAGPMADTWSHSAAVTSMHPIGGREVGWDEVGGSWEQFAKIASDGRVKLEGQLIEVGGDVAYELGTEHAAFKLAGHQLQEEIRVTNIYRREAGAWKIVHHHTDLSPATLEVLSRLQAEK